MPRVFAPLNPRQLDVLRWIADGCPKDVMQGYTYKTTAVALQSRQLVEVSKRGGQWRATITDAGVHYLAHNTFPGVPPRRGHPRRAARPAAAQGPPMPSTRRKPQRTATAKPPSPTDQLIADLLVTGEIRVAGPDRAKYEARVNAARRFGKVPEGKQLVTDGYRWSPEYVVRLQDAPGWLTATLDPVAVPKTLRQSHPVIAMLRGGRHLADLDGSVTHRALLLIQGLAVEARRRGYVVRATTTTDAYGFRSKADDQFTIAVGQHSVGVQLRQALRRQPHEPTAAEEARAARDHWYRIPKYDTMRTTRLSIHVSGRFEHRQSKWADGADGRLEDRLAQVLQEIELRAEAEERDRLASIAAAEERHRQWELAMDQARADYEESYRGKVLVEQATRWRKSNELGDYLSAMAKAVTSLGDPASASEARTWLEWAQNWASSLNPLAQTLKMPEVPNPSPNDLKPFLRC